MAIAQTCILQFVDQCLAQKLLGQGASPEREMTRVSRSLGFC
jgi:hypothetical protein